MRFLLNRDQFTADCDPATPALDFLRLQTGLTSVKAGCREGSCGACSVLLGELRPNHQVRYRAVNSCLLPMGAVAGHHLVSVEGLNGGDLTPVQQALVNHGAVQCGFCTPGLVIALTGYLLNVDPDQPNGVLEALDGNLCRCTGYAGIRRAGAELQRLLRDAFPGGLPPAERRLPGLIEQGLLPDWFGDIPERLAKLPQPRQAPTPPADALLVAGGTDLFSRDRDDLHHTPLWFAEQQQAWRGIQVHHGRCHIGAATTVEELMESPLLAQHIPAAHCFISHIAATPVRDRATVAGNLVNASPIGDLSVWLLALGTELHLQGPGGNRRLPLAELFIGYKKLALGAHEIITAIEFPLPEGELLFNFEKVAHRRYVDIASVNTAILLQRTGDRTERVTISAGGVAAVPMRLTHTGQWLQGLPIDNSTVRQAADMAMQEVTPMDDVRGSAAYKRLLLRQLLRAHFLTLAPDRVSAAGLQG